MGIEDLRKKFILDEDSIKERLEPIVSKALKFCVTDKQGQVHINDSHLPAKDRVMVVLAARAIASQLDETINPDVSVGEIARFTGLPENQVRARGKDCIAAKLAESSGRGLYRAVFYKVEGFLDNLSPGAQGG